MQLERLEEVFLASLLFHWEKTAPKDRHKGVLDGKPERNTQITRMARVLTLINAGTQDRIFNRLSVGASWKKQDGRQLLAKSQTEMIEPHELMNGWWLEGCANIDMKLAMLQDLTRVGYTPMFVRCACDFVLGKSISMYIPDERGWERIRQSLPSEDDSEGA